MSDTPHIPFDLELYRNQMLELIPDGPEYEIFWKALDYAAEAHDEQWRKSGDAYILHPCCVAKILAEEMDITHPEILSAALLHDTVEDVKEVTPEVVEEKFGSYVRAIVEGCTKVTHVSASSHGVVDKQTRSKMTHRKIFSGAALRPEVMLVKLADRLHNLRTLNAMERDKRQRVADETLAIYAPLATAFGLFDMKREMYNLALFYKYPKQGRKINSHIRKLRASPIGLRVVETLREATEKGGLACRINIRTKKLWAYYDIASKILVQRIDTPLEILVAVDDIPSCYSALGIINQTYPPIPRTIRDFIANPKPTGYQGLHARAMIDGQKFLFKIRTGEMARRAQRGGFRDWTSKHGKQSKLIKQIQEMFDVLGSEDSVSYRDVIAASGVKEIYTYTPQGDLLTLPVKSTVLDFAFRVHTAIGKTCKGAVIRGREVSASHILKDGDVVTIERSENPVRFEQDMSKKCKTPRARGELAKSFRIRRAKVTTEVGKAMLRQELLRYGIPFEILESGDADKLLEHFSMENIADLFRAVGEGRARLRKVLTAIKEILLNDVAPFVTPTGAFNRIELTTLDPVSVKLSYCCKPNPAAKDNCALVTRNGLSVHHKNCARFKKLNLQREDAVDISWRTRETRVRREQILHVLKASRREIMDVIADAPEEMELQNLEMLSRYSSRTPAWEMRFKVENLYFLQKVLRHFEKSGIVHEFVLDY